MWHTHAAGNLKALIVGHLCMLCGSMASRCWNVYRCTHDDFRPQSDIWRPESASRDNVSVELYRVTHQVAEDILLRSIWTSVSVPLLLLSSLLPLPDNSNV